MVWCRQRLWHGRLKQDKSRKLGRFLGKFLDRFHDDGLAPERTHRREQAIRPWWPTQACPDVLDLASQITRGLGIQSSGFLKVGRNTRMAIMMPASDQAVLDRRDAIVAALRGIVPGEGVIDSAAEMLPSGAHGVMAA